MDTLRQEGVKTALDKRLHCFIGIDKVGVTMVPGEKILFLLSI
jgi:hypothetical protein